MTEILTAGAELNEAIAEKVMGLRRGVDFGSLGDHEWARDEDGSIDTSAFEADNHTGPACVKCGYGYCHHCQQEPSEPCEKWLTDYSGGILSAFRMEERIAELGLVNRYAVALQDIIATTYRGPPNGFNFALIHASPVDRCRAALVAIGSR